MQSQTNLKDLERKLFRTSVQDGMIDIHIAVVLLIFSITPLLSTKLGDFWSSALFLPFWLLVFWGLRSFQKSYLYPRIGQIKYGAYRKRRLKNLHLVILVFNLAALGLGFASFFYDLFLPGWLPLPILFLVGFSLVGFLVESPRFYLYGGLSAVTPFIGEYLFQNHGFSHHGFPVVFGVLSGIILLWGVILILRIMHRYPLDEMEGRE